MKYISTVVNFLTLFGLISNQLDGYCENDQCLNLTDIKATEDDFNDTNDTEPIELDGTSLYNKNVMLLNIFSIFYYIDSLINLYFIFFFLFILYHALFIEYFT